jgi:hypothetical protein
MAYADFTLEDALDRLGLTPAEGHLFPGVTAEPVPGWLTELLALGGPLARVNEKSRSEGIVWPILNAARMPNPEAVAVHSGYRLDIDREAGLVGECDFLLAASPPLPVLRGPILSVVEAKRGDIELGMGQGIAQMVAASRFNARQYPPPDRPMYGCVTSGELWQFLRLDGTVLTVDRSRYYLDNVGLILGVLRRIVREFLPAA